MQKLPIKAAATATTLFILLLAVSSLQALAQGPGDPPPDEQAQPNQGENLRRLLGLTPDQMEKIRGIRQQNATDGQLIRRRVRQAQRALDQAIYSDTADEAEVVRLARELSEAQTAEVHMRARMELNIRRVLTPEQLNTFRKIRQERIMRAQMERRLENNQPRLPGIQRPGGRLNQPMPQNRNEARPDAIRPGERKAAPLLGPRERPPFRRIRP
ncbi:MAG TPA: Spy/CpxP family protein refolding chaperone [Pyrinomonadaceae bacterium]